MASEAVAVILKFAPMATSAVKSYLRSDLARSLDKRVRAQIEADPDLGPAAKESLLEQWHYLHHDGRVTVIIAGLLAEGDVAYLEALKIRAGEMLSGLEMLELGVDETVRRIVAAVTNNFVAAQKDATEAAQASTSTMLSAVEPLARQSDLMQLGPQIGRLEALVATPAPRVLILPSTFDEDQHRLLEELKARSESAAARLAQILNDSGVEGVAGAARSTAGWTNEEPAIFWLTAGRLLLEAGRLADAERAFAREADTPGAEDPVAAFIRAARVAEADERPTDADTYLEHAQAIEGEHPAVGLFLASRGATAHERLELAEAVVPRTDTQRAHQHKQRALALLDLRRFEEALDAANASAEVDPAAGGREMATLATIWGARDRLPARDRDDRPLIDAARYQLSLHDRQLALGNNAKAGIAGARAALATAILGDIRATGEAVDRVRGIDGGLEEGETRSTLLAAAVAVGDAARAQSLLPEPGGSVDDKLQRATIELLDGSNFPQVAALLDEVLGELGPGDAREQAVAMRLAAAGDPDVELNSGLASEHPEGTSLLAGANAQRALAAGDLAAARKHLAGLDDPPSLVLRGQIAEAEGKLPEAVGLQAALTRQFRSSENMLRLAGLRARAGDFAGAIRDALRLASDDRKLRSARDASYAIAAQAASDSGDYEELEDITDRWAELSPDRDDPPWAHAFALARQNRHAEALLYVNRRGLKPVADSNRHRLIAEIYMHGIPDSTTRLRALRDLSDEFGRPMELELALIGAVLQTPDSERPEDKELIARFQEAMSTFEERFPESRALTTITIDPDADGAEVIDQLAAVQGVEDQQVIDARQESIEGVRQARHPIGFLAAMVGRSTAETIIRLGAYPLAIFDDETHNREIAAAEAALDAAAASWDETACITLGLLSDSAGAAMVAALPGSLIGQSVSDSLNEAVRKQLGGKQVATMHVLPDGTPRIVEENPDTVERVREAEQAGATTAGKFAVTPDRGLGEDQLAAMVAERELNAPAAAAVSALVVARHHGLVLFSDDRVLRAFARTFEIEAFGTIALIEAMARRGLMSREEGEDAFRAVIDLGVWSLALEPAMYVETARRADYDVWRIGAALLSDEALMRVDPRVTHNALLLRAIAVEDPDKLEGWVTAMVMAYQEILKLEPLFIGSLLLAAQFDPAAADIDGALREVNTRIAEALRSIDGMETSDPDRDPVVGAVRRWVNVVEADHTATVTDNVLAQLDPKVADDVRAALAAGAHDAESGASGDSADATDGGADAEGDDGDDTPASSPG